jgi:hypothetical protein
LWRAPELVPDSLITPANGVAGVQIDIALVDFLSRVGGCGRPDRRAFGAADGAALLSRSECRHYRRPPALDSTHHRSPPNSVHADEANLAQVSQMVGDARLRDVRRTGKLTDALGAAAE